MRNTKVLVITISSILVVLLVLFIGFGTVIVPKGHTGVVSTLGKVSEDVLTEGFHLKSPIDSITKVDNRIVMCEVDTEAFSSDLQTVKVKLAVNYRIDPAKSYYLVKNVGTNYEDILIVPTVNEVLKSIVALHSAEQNITQRPTVSSDLCNNLNVKLNNHGIMVSDINIIDFDFSDTYINAIEEKQVAEQKKLKAQIEQAQLTLEKEAEAKRKIIDANAALEVSKIEAEAVEYAGQKEAAANKVISESLTNSLIEYNKIQKWNGSLPSVMGESVNPFITMEPSN